MPRTTGAELGGLVGLLEFLWTVLVVEPLSRR